VTRHDMFIATSCPGTYLARRLPDMVSTINQRLQGESQMIISRTQNNNHPIVKPVQEAIIFLDRPDAVITGGAQGIIGPTTDKAIKGIQKALAIPQDGVISLALLGGLLDLLRIRPIPISIAKAEYDKVVKNLSTATERIKGLESSVKTLTDGFNKANRTNEEMANEIKGYIKELKEQDDIMVSLQLKIDDLSEENDDLEEKLKTAGTQNAYLLEELEKKEPVIVDWQDATWKQLLKQAILKWWKSE